MKGVFSSAAAFALAFALFLSGCAATGGGHSDDNDGSYFVQLGVAREDLYIDGENLSVGEYEQLMGELRTLLNGLEEKFSVEIGESDLSRVNGAEAGQAVSVSEETAALLQMSREFAEESGGKFSPALYPLTELWGFSPANAGHYTDPRPSPSEESLQSARAVSDLSLFSLEEGNSVVKSASGAKLDFGGIAKGYMCDAVVSYIYEKYEGSGIDGIVNVSSSNSAYLGRKRDGQTLRGYNVGIENPRRLTTGISEGLYLVGVADASVTTSADNYRFYVYDGKIYPHIIDPETGAPADRGIISVTVVVPNAAHKNAGAFADALSTAAFCMPLTEAIGFFETLSQKYGIGAVMITRDFKYYAVGDVTVMNRKEYAEYIGVGSENIEEVFSEGNKNSATDEIAACREETEYIAKVESILN